MNRKTIAFVLFAGSTAIACSRGNSDSSPAASATVAEVSVAAVPVPVKEDFEVQAKQAISASNLEDKLDELDRQIGKAN